MSLAGTISQDEAYEIARDAYIYAYPLILTHTTIRQLSNFAESPDDGDTHGPPNQFHHARAFPDPAHKIVIRENVDTLYSAAVLDLKAGPMVLSVPATDRYFQLPMLSLWTDVFAVPGPRTTGANTTCDFLVTGPRWQGEVPAGLEVIESPTRYVWIIGRTQTNGAADYDNVHKVQDQFKLTPLSAWGKGESPPPKGAVDPSIDMKTPPPAQVDAMDAQTFYALVAELLKENPPNPCDYPMRHCLARIGFHVGESFDLGAAPADVKQAFERAYADGKAHVAQVGQQASGEGQAGWVYTTRSGAYGVDYDYRAAVANFGLGENLPQDAIYPSLTTDSDGNPLDGNHAYVLHLAKGDPPVEAFWSVTAYGADGYFIPNALNRQSIGDRSNLSLNPDGSIDLYFQADSPGADKEANWLPVAKAPFNLLMRLYSPKAAVLDGTWTPPLVKRQ